MNTPDPVTVMKAKAVYDQVENAIRLGDYDTAKTKLLEALDILETADGYYWLGVLYANDGDKSRAIDAYKSVLRIDPAYHKAMADMAKIYLGINKLPEALDYYGQAIEAAPDNAEYMQDLINLLRQIRLLRFNPHVKILLEKCLYSPQTEGAPFGRLWSITLSKDPAHKKLMNLLKKKDYTGFAKGLSKLKDYSTLRDPFFLNGLRKLVVCRKAFEDFLMRLRRFLLDHIESSPFDEGYLPLAASVAQYCFNTEYVFYCTAEEEKAVAALRTRAIENPTPRVLAVLACYQPLYALENAKDIWAQYTDDDVLGVLIENQIEDWIAQQDMKGRIEALTPVTQDVSAKVREQYEQFPYPRWKYLFPTVRDIEAEGFLSEGTPKILVAGCGTGGEAVELAMMYPQADILAIDMSLSSLAYGIHKAEEMGIDNVRFRQADILELGSIKERFDFITATGVLHHMEDPEKGWAVLVSLLNSGGRMRIGLYSEAARASIVEARAVIAAKGYGDDADGIRAFRHDAHDVLPKKSMKTIEDFYDYYLTSECRDLLFHVQEHRYTVPQLDAQIKKLGLEFLKFNVPDDVLEDYILGHKDDLMGRNLQGWAEYEAKNPDTFKGMYIFWVTKP
ncbi:MAG: methyltransferase domain-containing protein [Rhodospirillales bacterium]|nr:methyltransferase domain-containing protein [Rhodospirillales bacterium]MCB9996428.1 methyltransferase domain-containing protein [Rhodospirillales bacterium]